MSELETDILAISVDADDYASAAAEDAPPSESRTFQSESAFEYQKSIYTAKHDGGTSYRDLIAAVPCLTAKDYDPSSSATVALTKRDVLCLGYAVGELYFARRYADVIELCERVQSRCEVKDVRVRDAMDRWIARCRTRMAEK